ncbi:MAG TPA: uracil-DNA glycosylase family protein, partial [Burkholderiales bacterium]|nr:uracil-DNA glycosylase family protein [Burkholderiales bacterium]
MSETARQVLNAAARLRDAVDDLKFSSPVSHVYNPLNYAWLSHQQYVKHFATAPRRILFLGMNPGPFGMAQTGVPFGEIKAVRDWMGIHARVLKPRLEHPKRPVLGFNCPRCEVSGQRLWGLFAQRFGSAENFFREHYVVNYCPLAFLSATGSNLTPDKLPRREVEKLFAACDEHLHRVVELLQPEWVIGIGGFAYARVELLGKKFSTV